MQQSIYWFCRQVASLAFMQLNFPALQNRVATSELPTERNFWSNSEIALGNFLEKQELCLHQSHARAHPSSLAVKTTEFQSLEFPLDLIA